MKKKVDIGATTYWPEKEEEQAFYQTLFHTYYADLCKFSFSIIKDKAKAEDIVQDVFIMLWQKRRSISFSFSIKSYVFKSVYNKSITAYHQHTKRIKVDLEEASGAAEGVTAVEWTQAEELKEAIAKAIAEMTDGCRTIFLMSREEALSYKEISDILGISIKTVENQMGKALKHLRIHLNEYLILILFFTVYRG